MKADCVNCEKEFEVTKDGKSLVIEAKTSEGTVFFFVCDECSVYVPGANEPKDVKDE